VRIRTDADWIEYCIDNKLEEVRDTWMVLPLIIGIFAAFIAVVLSGCSSFGWEWQTITLCGIACIIVGSPVVLSQIMAYPKMKAFLNQRRPLRRDMEPILRLYQDKAAFDALMTGAEKNESTRDEDFLNVKH